MVVALCTHGYDCRYMGLRLMALVLVVDSLAVVGNDNLEAVRRLVVAGRLAAADRLVVVDKLVVAGRLVAVGRSVADNRLIVDNYYLVVGFVN